MTDDPAERRLEPATLDVAAGDAAIEFRFGGDWLLINDLPQTGAIADRIARAGRGATISFDTSSLGRWDTGLVATLVDIRKKATAQRTPLDESGLPEGVRQLLALAFTRSEREGARRHEEEPEFVEFVGVATLDILDAARALSFFTGQMVLSFGRFLAGRATYLKRDLVLHIQEAGAEALPIISLISFLIGMIFAFVGVMQLRDFGAGIYTADLVAIAMVREMAPIMTAILMAGRTGAAYAAQIGTMRVNEEIDALSTLGIHPMDFLVTPRLIALVLMMPLLSICASLMGILGGTVVSLGMLDVSLIQYVSQTIDSVDLSDLSGGLFKSVVYGSLVALAGCQQGMACGNSAMAVGQSTTRAVVMGIVLIVVSASVLTVIYINFGI